jgi:hypothetical protein
MPNSVAKPIVGVLAVLVVSSVVLARNPDGRAGQAARGGTTTNAAQPTKDATPAGPAPKHDLNGVWVGSGRGGGQPFPPYTAQGKKMFSLNKPEPIFHLAASNDPIVTCDPLGFPHVLNPPALSQGMRFAALPNLMIVLYQYQTVWREIWMDGRELPKKVDAKGAPDSRFYGFSVGHWDGDSTFIADTVGLDDRTWLDRDGHPHSVDMQVVERYTRADQNTMQLTLTINDPKVYTMPFDWIKNATYKWTPKQDFGETFCVPSEALAYRDTLATPAGNGDPAK